MTLLLLRLVVNSFWATVCKRAALVAIFGSRPSDHYFRSVHVCLFVCAEFFSAVFDPISIKLGHYYVICLGLVVSPRI